MTHKDAKTKLLRDLNKRMQARSNGVLALFRQAGFEQARPDIKTLYEISQVNEDIYNSIIKLIYEDGESANALGWADWASAGAGALQNFFGSVSKSSDGDTVDSEAKAKAEAEAKAKAEAEAKKTKTVTIIIVAVIVVVMVIGGLVYFKRKK